MDGPNFIEVNLELVPRTQVTWVSQFCSVVGLDDIDGLLAGCDFIRLIMYVSVRVSILWMATEGHFQRIQMGPHWNTQVKWVYWQGDYITQCPCCLGPRDVWKQ